MNYEEMKQRLGDEECVWVDPWQITGFDAEHLSSAELSKDPFEEPNPVVQVILDYYFSLVWDDPDAVGALDGERIVRSVLWLIQWFGASGATHSASFVRDQILNSFPIQKVIDVWRPIAEDAGENPRLIYALRYFLSEMMDGDMYPGWITELEPLIRDEDFEFVVEFFQGSGMV